MFTEQDYRRGLINLVLLQSSATNTCPRFRDHVLFVVGLCSLPDADVVQSVVVPHILASAGHQLKEFLATGTGNEQETMPVPGILALVVINVVDQSMQISYGEGF